MPPVLVSQWQSEVAKHAPRLRVVTYEGLGSGDRHGLGDGACALVRDIQNEQPPANTNGTSPSSSLSSVPLSSSSSSSSISLVSSSMSPSTSSSSISSPAAAVLRGCWAATFCDADVVLTTYATLAKDLKRHGPHRHSPLLHCDWWRVALDEAQVNERTNEPTNE